jgi:preprotein translocase subunit SecA
MNRHREVIYSMRRKALAAESLREDIVEMIRKEIAAMVAAHTDSRTGEIDHEQLRNAIGSILPVSDGLAASIERAHESEIVGLVMDEVEALYDARTEQFTPDMMRIAERFCYINALDRLWIEHLEAMDSLRNGIGLRAIGQRDPLVEYKREGYRVFQQLVGLLDAEVATTIFRMSITQNVLPEAPVETALTRAAEQAHTNADIDGIQAPAAGGSRQERRAKVNSGGGATKKHKKRR